MLQEIDKNYYIDTDILGEVNSKGLIKRYVDKEAVKNSIIVWLTSFANDILRNPGRGGYVTKLLYKPMTKTAKTNLREAIVDGFNQDFTPSATLQTIDIEADYTNKQWTINLSVYIDVVKDTVDVEQTIKNFV